MTGWNIYYIIEHYITSRWGLSFTRTSARTQHLLGRGLAVEEEAQLLNLLLTRTWWRHHLSFQCLPWCRIILSRACCLCRLSRFLQGAGSWRGAPALLAAQGQRRITGVSESWCHQLQCSLMKNWEQTSSGGESANENERGFKHVSTHATDCIPLFLPFTPASVLEGKWLAFKWLLSGWLHNTHGLNFKHIPETPQWANTD